MHHLTQEQVRRLLQAIPTDRERTALLVTYLHGLRISETLALRVQDIQGGYLTVQRGKGSMKTTQALYAPSDLGSWLDEKTAIENLILTYQLQRDDFLFQY